MKGLHKLGIVLAGTAGLALCSRSKDAPEPEEPVRAEENKDPRACDDLEEEVIKTAIKLAQSTLNASKDGVFPVTLAAEQGKVKDFRCTDLRAEDGLGFIGEEDRQTLSPSYFEARNVGCAQAATHYALGLCVERGACNAYDGPSDPALPYGIKDEITAFMGVCEKVKAGEVTPGGQTFEGKREGAIYTGMVSYPNGATATGDFKKDAQGEFTPTGDFLVILKDGGKLKGTTDGENSTEESAVYTPKEGDPLDLAGNPDQPDLNWLRDIEDSNNTLEETYTFDSKTGELKAEDKRTDPNGVEIRGELKDSDKATFTGYASFKKFTGDEEAYESYEGFWKSGKFQGKGTLVLKNGQTLEGEFKEGAPVATAKLKFKESTKAEVLDLEWLSNETDWMHRTSETTWDKYTRDATKKEIVVAHMRDVDQSN